MKLRKITAALLAAGMLAGASVPAYAEEIRTETVSVAYLASSAKEWNGKSALEAGKSYTVSSNITVSKNLTIPKKTTVTVKKGSTLTIGSKGSLTVEGTLNVQTKATLAVNGALTLNSGRPLQCDGAITFGKTAVAKLNGKFSVLNNGSVSGTPSKVTVGKTAAVIIAGKNNCSKLKSAISSNYAALKKASSTGKVSEKTAKKELQEHYNKHLSLLFSDNAYVHSINAAYCDQDIKLITDKAAQYKINADEFLYDNSDMLKNEVLRNFSLGKLSSAADVKSVQVKITEAVDCTSLKEAVAQLKPRYGSVTQYWLAVADYTFTMKNGKTHTTKNAYIGFVYSNGNIYVISEELSEASFK